MVDRMGGMVVWIYSADEYHPECCVEMLVERGELSPAARGMDPEDALRQYVESNGEDFDMRDWDSDHFPQANYYWDHQLIDSEGGPRHCGRCLGMLDDGYECEICGGSHGENAHGEALESRDHGIRTVEDMLLNQIHTMEPYLLEFHVVGTREKVRLAGLAALAYKPHAGDYDEEVDLFNTLLEIEDELEDDLRDWTKYLAYNSSDAGMWWIYEQSDKDNTQAGVAEQLRIAAEIRDQVVDALDRAWMEELYDEAIEAQIEQDPYDFGQRRPEA